MQTHGNYSHFLSVCIFAVPYFNCFKYEISYLHSRHQPKLICFSNEKFQFTDQQRQSRNNNNLWLVRCHNLCLWIIKKRRDNERILLEPLNSFSQYKLKSSFVFLWWAVVSNPSLSFWTISEIILSQLTGKITFLDWASAPSQADDN